MLRGYDKGRSVTWLFTPQRKEIWKNVPRNCVHSNMAVAFFGGGEIFCPKQFQTSTVELRSWFQGKGCGFSPEDVHQPFLVGGIIISRWHGNLRRLRMGFHSQPLKVWKFMAKHDVHRECNEARIYKDAFFMLKWCSHWPKAPLKKWTFRISSFFASQNLKRNVYPLQKYMAFPNDMNTCWQPHGCFFLKNLHQQKTPYGRGLPPLQGWWVTFSPFELRSGYRIMRLAKSSIKSPPKRWKISKIRF